MLLGRSRFDLPAYAEVATACQEIRSELRRVVGESTYDIWLASLEMRWTDPGVLLLAAPDATQPWIAKRFGRVLESCARAVLGPDVRVAFAGATAEGNPAAPPESATAVDASASGGLNPRYTFDQFIIGDGNRLAHAAALAVAELPGQAYNPLFLYAPPGLGKTHLLHAIGNYVVAFAGGATVRYATVEAFTNHFISALSSRSLDRFKRAYRSADVLLIDDVQFLASKAKTEEEFFHTFNALYEDGRQLVLTCDRLPHQMHNVEARLRERFEAGLVAAIKPPDFATRVAILRKRAALDRVPLADTSVLDLIAERVTRNVRTLEGALIRIVAHHSLNRKPIDVNLAQSVLDNWATPAREQPIELGQIQAAVATHFDLTVSELTSSSREARIAWPRQLALHLSRELTDASLASIGEAFGGRNHATVLHACRRVAERLASDQQAVHDVDEISAALRTSQPDRHC
jgi:chromosomal replication initiator protein